MKKNSPTPRLLTPLVLCFGLLFLPKNAPAQSIDSVALGRLSDAIMELQNSELMHNGTLAFCLKSTKDNRMILAMHHEQSVPSASTLKLVTTATVLSALGGDYTYPTYLEYDGLIVRDTLRGNLYVRGSGDPSLGSDRFKNIADADQLLARWTAAVRRAGIHYVQGQVLADPTFFDDKTLADTWVWGDLGNYYGAGVSGLNFRENLYRVSFQAGRNVGDPTEVTKLEPEMPYVKITNLVTTAEAGTGDQVYIYTSPLGEEIRLTGTVPRGSSSFTVKGAVPNPAFAVAYELTRALKAGSVGIAGAPDVQPSFPKSTATRKILDVHQSASLRELCQQTNWWSINLYADAFLKASGKKLGGRSAFDDAVKSEAAYWLTRGADTRGFYVKDGSGLSPTGSLTAQNLTDVLNAATREKSFPDFYNSIAILGQTGTVRNIGKGTRSAGRVRAKSGSIGGTRAYAGYAVTRAGERLSFTIIAHKYLPDGSGEVSRTLRGVLVLLGEL